MSWLKIVGWALFVLPIIGFAGFTIWMMLELMKDDKNVATFVMILVAAWFVGIGLLLLSYFTDFAILAGL